MSRAQVQLLKQTLENVTPGGGLGCTAGSDALLPTGIDKVVGKGVVGTNIDVGITGPATIHMIVVTNRAGADLQNWLADGDARFFTWQGLQNMTQSFAFTPPVLTSTDLFLQNDVDAIKVDYIILYNPA